MKMNIITLDFESFYSQTYSLSKMTTEEYVRGAEFEVIGVAVKVNDGETQWFSGTYADTKKFLEGFAFEDNLALAHNAVFDAAILTWHFGITPRGWLDTLSMARAIHSTEVGGSLAKLTEFYGLGQKGDEVVKALGKRRIDFNAQDLAAYGQYCINDVELTHKLFGCLSANFPAVELRLIDLTVRMFSEPVLELDRTILEAHLEKQKIVKAHLLTTVGMDNRDALMSNDKFADLLAQLKVSPPRKLSPTTGKETWAFSKTDEKFKELAEHPNAIVQMLVAARLGLKSTQEETRTQRFIDIQTRGKLPIPLRYYAAHTGRWGGDDKINLQNLKRGSLLKGAIHAPDGFMMVDSDSSQIEARTVAWLAGQDDLVQAFDEGKDVYKIMASAIYGKPESEITKDERFVGKTTILGCISEGTLVLCNSGWKPIEKVSMQDKLWDGEEWVCHQGLVQKGYKETLNVCGVWLTPDHKILCGAQWKEAQLVVQDKSTLSLALGTAVENLPLRAISKGYGVGWVPLLLDVVVGNLSTQWTRTTLGALKVPDAIRVLKNRATQLGNYTGATATYSKIMRIGRDYLTALRAASRDATQSLIERTCITEVEGLQFTRHGVQTGKNSCAILLPSKDGTSQPGKLTVSTTTRDTSRITYDLQPGQKISVTNALRGRYKKKLMTYDIAYAGPRNRFLIATNRGPLIVHNCGYGMGATKFEAQLKTFGVDIEEAEASRIIQVYRDTYAEIPKLWRAAGKALDAIADNRTCDLGRKGVVVVEGAKGIRMPNGLHIKYPNLRKRSVESGNDEYVYDTKRGKAVIPNKIYGGKVVENLCQGLARIIIGEQMLQIAKKYRVVMTVHDAVAIIAPEQEILTAQEYVELCMRMRPSWALDLPLNCESGYGKSYGEC